MMDDDYTHHEAPLVRRPPTRQDHSRAASPTKKNVLWKGGSKLALTKVVNGIARKTRSQRLDLNHVDLLAFIHTLESDDASQRRRIESVHTQWTNNTGSKVLRFADFHARVKELVVVIDNLLQQTSDVTTMMNFVEPNVIFWCSVADKLQVREPERAYFWKTVFDMWCLHLKEVRAACVEVRVSATFRLANDAEEVANPTIFFWTQVAERLASVRPSNNAGYEWRTAFDVWRLNLRSDAAAASSSSAAAAAAAIVPVVSTPRRQPRVQQAFMSIDAIDAHIAQEMADSKREDVVAQGYLNLATAAEMIPSTPFPPSNHNQQQQQDASQPTRKPVRLMAYMPFSSLRRQPPPPPFTAYSPDSVIAIDVLTSMMPTATVIEPSSAPQLFNLLSVLHLMALLNRHLTTFAIDPRVPLEDFVDAGIWTINSVARIPVPSLDATASSVLALHVSFLSLLDYNIMTLVQLPRFGTYSPECIEPYVYNYKLRLTQLDQHYKSLYP